MSRLAAGIKYIFHRYPVMRGMATFSLLWPTSNGVQQVLDKSRSKIDLPEMSRYFIFGTFVIAPTVYGWIKLVGFLVPGNTLKHIIGKLAMDVAIFTPLGQTQFYLGINLLEGRTWEQSVAEWKKKLLPTWKAASCFWPFIQFINYVYVPERNRVVILSFASFVWTMFLSYMHHSKGELSLPHRSKITHKCD